MSGWSRRALVAGLARIDARGKAFVPPTWSMWAWVSTRRRTGGPSPATAAANGPHWERTMRQSTTVSPSSSATTAALLIPEPPPGCSHAQTPSPNFSSSTPAPYPGADSPPLRWAGRSGIGPSGRRTPGAARSCGGDPHGAGGGDEGRLVPVVPPHLDQRPVHCGHDTAPGPHPDLLRLDFDPSTNVDHGAPPSATQEPPANCFPSPTIAPGGAVQTHYRRVGPFRPGRRRRHGHSRARNGQNG